MKKIKKILAAALVSASLFSTVGAFNAFAASSVSGSVGGFSCFGFVSYSVANRTATATTGFSAGGTLKVTAKAYYVVNGQVGVATASNTSNGGGIYVTAYAPSGGVVCGAKGIHKVEYNHENWSGTTSNGTVW